MLNLKHIRIKVCGMKNQANIQQVGSFAPDYIGFIFYKDSPRYVGADFRIPELPSSIRRVGVFVNESIENVLNTIEKYALDFAQLHGDESIEFCRAIKLKGISIIKVFRVDDEFDFHSTLQFSDVADYFLFDTKGRNYGGNAIKFNWQLLNRYHSQVPFFLSGGIDLESISELVGLKEFNLHAIDVNSGVEVSPGLKDVTKVSTIINTLRA